MVGWKRAMDLRLNQRHMLDQLQQVHTPLLNTSYPPRHHIHHHYLNPFTLQAVHITSVDNLHCNDLSDMTNLDANAGHSGLKQSITFTE